jgi:undecaprenyl-diphosphatase
LEEKCILAILFEAGQLPCLFISCYFYLMDVLYSLDLWLFRLGNRTLANPVFDFLLPILTNERYFIVPYVIILLLLVWKGGRAGRLCVGIVLLTIILGDQINSSIIKEAVGRIRPCHVLPDVRLLVGCGAGKSFPSTHAVNNFAAATVFGYFYRSARPYLFGFATLVAYTRVYCGVHYPFDVLGGAVFGIVLALLVLFGWYKAFERVNLLALPNSPLTLFSARSGSVQ